MNHPAVSQMSIAISPPKPGRPRRLTLPRRKVLLSLDELKRLRAHPLLADLPGANCDERTILRGSTQKHGVLHPILISGRQLLDGRERVAQAISSGISLAAWDFFEATESDRKEIILGVTCGRAHWVDGQKALVAAKHLCGAEGMSKRKAAAAVGVSATYMCEAMDLLSSESTLLIEEVKVGKTPLSTAHRKLREMQARESERLTAAREPATQIELRRGRFQDCASDIRDNSVDAIITDPLYDLEFIPDIKDLGRFAERVLKPGGVLVIMYGSAYADEMIMALRPSGPSLRKVWNFAAKLNGATSSHPSRRVRDEKRDYFAYVKSAPRISQPKTINGMPRSLFEINETNTLYSPFGQDEGAFSPFIEWYTNPGDLVIDPFAGGGAVPAACKSLGRRCIACEQDHAIFAGIVGRFFGSTPQEVGEAPNRTIWGMVEK